MPRPSGGPLDTATAVSVPAPAFNECGGTRFVPAVERPFVPGFFGVAASSVRPQVYPRPEQSDVSSAGMRLFVFAVLI